MPKVHPFDEHPAEYDQWFDDHSFVYLSELEALRRVLPAAGEGVEIGVGTGRFAHPLGIAEGCDPSAEMRARAARRGIHVIPCAAESLPYENERFAFALMVTTICFVDDPEASLAEIRRILKPHGQFILAWVDKNSPLGRRYQAARRKSSFYREARFFGRREIKTFLTKTGFVLEQTWQTVFGPLPRIQAVQEPACGAGKGGFVVMAARKGECVSPT
ncbi:MAG: class I SAM-dependent methyltransferase [Candidatus Aminicenantes bacterium]|nr:class I SAM-dependent methyltransferase [Candidatus Aminicenantes bacterium]